MPDGPSIAVRAFETLGSQPEETYFADGVVEDIITELSKCPSLVVIARNTTFAFA